MQDNKVIGITVSLAVLLLFSTYGLWFFSYNQNTPTKVGVVYWPILYNQQEALTQLRQISNGGFKVWATDISPDASTGSENYLTLKACLVEADNQSLSCMLRLPYLLSKNSSRYEVYLKDFAHHFDSFLVLNEIGNLSRSGYTNDEILEFFDEWYDLIKQYNPYASVLTSFVGGYVLSEPDNTQALLTHLESRLDAVGVSVYPHDLAEASLPLVFNQLEKHTSKPLWVTEVGSKDGEWTVRMLEALHRNNVKVAVVWCWETFWGDTSYNIRDSVGEEAISSWIKNR